MTQELKLFTFAPVEGVEFSIRTLWIEGSPWFIAADVCRALGLGGQHVSMHLKKLAEDEKGDNRIVTPGGAQNVRIVSESGLYKLAMRSDNETAQKFQEWVTRVVLVSIRTTGGYSIAVKMPTPTPLQLPASTPRRSPRPSPHQGRRVLHKDVVDRRGAVVRGGGRVPGFGPGYHPGHFQTPRQSPQ